MWTELELKKGTLKRFSTLKIMTVMAIVIFVWHRAYIVLLLKVGHKTFHSIPICEFFNLHSIFLLCAVIRVGFDQIEFFTQERLERFNLGLLVCVTVEDVLFPFSLITTPEDGTAQGTSL